MEAQKPCTCAPAVVTKYQKRISGPILNRIDIHIEVQRVDYEKLSGDRVGETSASIRSRVQMARDIQTRRFSNIESSDIICNADMRVGEIRQFCKVGEEGQRLMRTAMTQLNLSRAYHRILKLARAIADLAGSEEIQSVHLAEALHASQPTQVDDGMNTVYVRSACWRRIANHVNDSNREAMQLSDCWVVNLPSSRSHQVSAKSLARPRLKPGIRLRWRRSQSEHHPPNPCR